MKKDLQELKTKPSEELQKLLGEAREKLRTLKLDIVSGKASNTSEVRKAKTYIARVLTFIHEKAK